MSKHVLFQDKRELVEALLCCGAVAHRHTRDNIVDELRHDIKSSIHRHNTDKHDVMEIVKRCLDFDDGLSEFVDIVRFYEGGSRPMAVVDEIAGRLAGVSLEDPVEELFTGATFPEPGPKGLTTGESAPAKRDVRVFVSHADEDAEIAGKLYDDLEAAGVSPWMASRDLPPGSKVRTALNQAVKNSRYFIALLSQKALSSPGEAQLAMKRAFSYQETLPENVIYFIPVRIDDCRPMELDIEARKPADLFPSYASGLRMILKAVAPDADADDILTGKKTEETPIIRRPYAGDVFCLSVVVRGWGNAVYRIYLKDRVTLGHKKDADADIQIGAGGVQRKHGYVERRGNGYYLVPGNGACRISGAEPNQPLKPGVDIRIGESFVIRPVSVSGRALVIDMPDPNPVDQEIQGFILMNRRLSIGADPKADLRIPALKTAVSLIEKNRGFSAEAGRETADIDFGIPADIGGAGIFLSREPGSAKNP